MAQFDPWGDEFGSGGGSLLDAISERIADCTRWLREHAPYIRDEQKHLDEGTRERAYWHHGYCAALRDARNYLRRKRRRS